MGSRIQRFKKTRVLKQVRSMKPFLNQSFDEIAQIFDWGNMENRNWTAPVQSVN